MKIINNLVYHYNTKQLHHEFIPVQTINNALSNFYGNVVDICTDLQNFEGDILALCFDFSEPKFKVVFTDGSIETDAYNSFDECLFHMKQSYPNKQVKRISQI